MKYAAWSCWILYFSLAGPLMGQSSSHSAVDTPAKHPQGAAKKHPNPKYAITSGAWSAATISLFNTWTALDDNPGRHVTFNSPDHKKTIEVIETDVTLRVDGKVFATDIGAKHDAELGWAPDSSKFFVTWTETGELGPWHTQVYRVTEAGLQEIPKITDIARKDFEQRVRKWPVPKQFNSLEGRQFWSGIEYCEPYHVIGGKWLNGSKELLVTFLGLVSASPLN